MSNEYYDDKLRALSHLRYHGVKLTERMKEAFLKVPREEFVFKIP